VYASYVTHYTNPAQLFPHLTINNIFQVAVSSYTAIVAGQCLWGFHATKLDRFNDTTHREQFKGMVYLLSKLNLQGGKRVIHLL
jgi:hypothetical protein